MARVVKEYDTRRNEILDAAQSLFYSKGYEATSVQEIIDAVGIAKGTFYHYFSSKLDLLNALIERMVAQILASQAPMVDDPDLSALEKYHCLFANIGNWKTSNIEFWMNLIPIWYSDDNALFREKVATASIAHVVPLMTQIIQQGVDEGVFQAEYPDEMAQVTLKIGRALSDELVIVLFDASLNSDTRRVVAYKKVTAYQGAIERALSAPTGSINLFKPEILEAWLNLKIHDTQQGGG